MFNFFNRTTETKTETRDISSATVKNTFPVSSRGTQLGVTTRPILDGKPTRQ